MSRDRDEQGRPRNARPRDATGRPLARDPGTATPDDPPALPPDEAIDLAGELLAEGRAFRAHEVFEAVWKSTDTDRELWRGLAQLAVGITHAQRGNATGSRALLSRGADTLAPWAGTTPYGLDIDGLRAWAREPDAMAAGPPPLRRR
ncbi:MAG: uncharacterized protein QOD07_1971 [Frankiaceae bacterium]|nr:uncharacterized protein [Frankiaceae bacterium]